MPPSPTAWPSPARLPARTRPDGPLSFRVVRFSVGVVGGLFGLVLLLGALAPAIHDEVLAAVDARLALPEEAELPPLRERSALYAADGELLALLHDEEEREVVSLSDLPDHLSQAIIAAEDRRFFEHEGYDPEGIGRALLANVQARGIAQGGSTITQQLAKLNFLDDARTLQRKLAELVYAVALEREMDKHEILERYLNQVYFGAGAYGVQAAAEEYWGIDAADLQPQQSALLAAIIRAPGIYDPRRAPEQLQERRNRVLDAMAAEGFLDPVAAADLAAAPLDLVGHEPTLNREPHVAEAVKREFLANPAFGDTREERIELLFGGGIQLHTTIDPDLQEIARAVVADHYPDFAPTAAIATLEPDTGAVVALQGGRDFEHLQYDLALQGRRQPGSAFKTFVMLEALRQGVPPSQRFEASSPLRIELPDEVWEVRNYGGQSFGDIDMREATIRSVNTYYAQLARRVGVSNIRDLTADLGISSDAYGRYGGLAAVSIGGLDRGLTPLEMAGAYGVIANGGVRAEPYFLARVERDGRVLWSHDAQERRVLDTEVAGTAVDILRDVVERGTGTRARIAGWDVIGKTGTTNDNYDAWFAGATPRLATAVWVGHPEGNVVMPNATGGVMAAPVWREFMAVALEGYDPAQFPEAGSEEADTAAAP